MIIYIYIYIYIHKIISYIYINSNANRMNKQLNAITDNHRINNKDDDTEWSFCNNAKLANHNHSCGNHTGY